MEIEVFQSNCKNPKIHKRWERSKSWDGLISKNRVKESFEYIINNKYLSNIGAYWKSKSKERKRIFWLKKPLFWCQGVIKVYGMSTVIHVFEEYDTWLRGFEKNRWENKNQW